VIQTLQFYALQENIVKELELQQLQEIASQDIIVQLQDLLKAILQDICALEDNIVLLELPHL